MTGGQGAGHIRPVAGQRLMVIRIVDYVGNLGGGIRYITEIVRQLVRNHGEVKYQFVSHGAALARYRKLFSGRGIPIETRDIRPKRFWRNKLGRLAGRWGTKPLVRMLALGTRWNIEVPEQALSDCDLIWVPWINQHVMPDGFAHRTVGTLADIIALQFKLLFKEFLDEEHEGIRRWVNSRARLVTISDAAAEAVTSFFDVPRGRISTIRLSGVQEIPATQPRSQWRWADKPFLFCPANIAVHKNHETLFKGFAEWGQKHPLVLTGGATEKLNAGLLSLLKYSRRARHLARAAQAEGLQIGRTLLPLGYCTDGEYYALLRRAWALVTTTLAEGCGLPVLEAVRCGTPVICSDIPVLREYVELLGAKVLWFDPHDSAALVERLDFLEHNHAAYAKEVMNRVEHLRSWQWSEVADEYWQVFTSISGSPIA